MAEKDDGTAQSSNTLLLDLAQAMGRIEGQNQLILQEQARAADGRKEQYKRLDALTHDTKDVKDTVAAIASRVTTLEPDVKNMKAFRAQLALAVFFVTTAVTGAINLIVLAVTHLGDIKGALREFLK